jgi:hypothetical protein
MKRRLVFLGVALALVAVLVVPFAAFADSTNVTGTLSTGTTFVFTAPGAISLNSGTLQVGDNAGNSSGSVKSGLASWVLSVEDANQGTNTGHMIVVGNTDKTIALASPLNLCTTSDGAFGTIAAYQTLFRGSSGYATKGTWTLPLFANQAVAGTDLNGSYSITLNWTVTPGS